MRFIAAIVAALLLGGCLQTDLTWQRRQLEKELREEVEAVDRFVDISVRMHVVVADPNGQELLEGKPRLRVLRTHRLGGVVDTKITPPRVIGPGRRPVDWYCSEDQEPVILHGDALALGQLVYGSEGAGKTVALAMWHYVRWLEHLGEGREGGQTAPTIDRLSLVRDEMFRLYPSAWFRYRASEDILTFCDGTRLRLVSTYQQSAAQGSPIQGFSWSWCGRDEGQDSVDRHSDIESRGRAAKHGRYKQLITATAKDDTAWRTLKGALLSSGLWQMRTLLGMRSPFVHPSFWEAKRKTMTEREFRRRVLAEDVGPERMVYFSWTRDSVRPIPRNARRITPQVLRAKTGNPRHGMLVGSDPGVAKAASIFLDAYRIDGSPDILWWVRGELFTTHETTEQHGLRLVKMLRDEWGMNVDVGGQIAHVRADPYGHSEAHPDRDVYLTLSRIGLDVRAAQYNKKGDGVGRIGLEARIEMINRLLCDATGRQRLFIEADEQGRPRAPVLVESLESMERDVAGRAERDKKNLIYDKSDCPAALAYALWPFEKESAVGLRAAMGDA